MDRINAEPPTDISDIEMVEVRTPSAWIPVAVMGGTVVLIVILLIVFALT